MWMGWMSIAAQNAAAWLGQVGYVARGGLVAGIGVAALGVAVTYQAFRAVGVERRPALVRLDQLRPLAAQPRVQERESTALVRSYEDD
jgi:hypothetical protein